MREQLIVIDWHHPEKPSTLARTKQPLVHSLDAAKCVSMRFCPPVLVRTRLESCRLTRPHLHRLPRGLAARRFSSVRFRNFLRAGVLRDQALRASGCRMPSSSFGKSKDLRLDAMPTSRTHANILYYIYLYLIHVYVIELELQARLAGQFGACGSLTGPGKLAQWGPAGTSQAGRRRLPWRLAGRQAQPGRSWVRSLRT